MRIETLLTVRRNRDASIGPIEQRAAGRFRYAKNVMRRPGIISSDRFAPQHLQRDGGLRSHAHISERRLALFNTNFHHTIRLSIRPQPEWRAAYEVGGRVEEASLNGGRCKSDRP